jgi:ribosomal protein S18 acetylase RimI-like enzyme
MVAKDGEPAAVGLGVAERGWLGIFCVITFSKFRRQGLASQVMRGLAEWGKTVEVEQVYLQVMENNPPALAMYENQGFKKLYSYWYSQKGLD